MKTFLALVCIVGIASPVFADSYGAAKQRAKTVSNQMNQRQTEAQRPPAAQPAPVLPPAQAPPPNPALAAMQLNISNIANDLALIQSDASKKLPLIGDLSAAAQGKPPSKAAVAKLADDLALALGGKSLAVEPRKKLAQYLRAMLNSSHLAPAQERTVIEDVQKILQAAGAAADRVTLVVADLNAIAIEVK